MVKHLPVILLAVVALAALAAAGPASADGNGEHNVERRGLRGLFRKAKHKVQNVGKKVGHALHADVNKLKGCLRRMPGLPKQALHIAEGCALSAFGGVAAVGVCVAGSGAIPAARATAHLAVCMG